MRNGIRIDVLARAMLVVVGFGALPGRAAAGDGWLAAYVAPQGDPTPTVSISDLTVRQIVRFEAAGSRFRITMGNQGGSDTVVADHLRIALLDANNRVVAGSDRPLTFGIAGNHLSLRAGTSIASDAIDMRVSRGQTAAITIYYPAQQSHRTNYVKAGYSARGDHSADAMPITTNPSGGMRGIVQRIEVIPTTAKRALVTIGDSITAGFNSTAFSNRSYPEQLTDRFGTIAGGGQWSVVNAGISGNRILHDGNGPCLLSRFARDALDVPGVASILVLEGVNDIGHPADRKNAADPQVVTSDQIKAAFRTLIAQAHARGVRIYFGTILPYGAAGYFSAEGETIRQAVNTWIRANDEADGFVEFAEPMQDPGHAPSRIKPALSGNGDPAGSGGLHPNDAGYAVMAQQVQLTTIENSSRSTGTRARSSVVAECPRQ